MPSSMQPMYIESHFRKERACSEAAFAESIPPEHTEFERTAPRPPSKWTGISHD